MDNSEILLLTTKAQNGDIQAFELLISKHQKKVYNIAFNYLKNYDDAQEISQEAFIKAFKSIKQFNNNSTFTTWLYRITTNTCIDFLRKSKNKQAMSLDMEISLNNDSNIRIEVASKEDTPDIIYEKMELKKTIYSALDHLKEEQKSVVILKDIQGFNYEEISEILNIPIGTVRSRLNRSRKYLKELLQDKIELFRQN